jgi:flavin reductase (DIM6/NTAB) family NADH-FMN oxidoreductase RutF
MMAIGELDRRYWLRLFQPSPVVLVTSLYRSHPNVMTAAWISPMGFDPPLITLGIHPGRLTHTHVSKSETFGISIPTFDLIRKVHQCGMVSGRDVDKFERYGLNAIDPLEIEAPRIDQCVAYVECGVVHRLSMTDHDLFVGEIITAEAERGIFSDRWHSTGDSPLIHHLAAEYYAGTTRPYSVQFEEEDE